MARPAKSIVIRTAASPAVGWGHAMRCLALAQQWRAGGGDVGFVLRGAPDQVRQQLAEVGSIVALEDPAGAEVDLATTARRAEETNAAWIVVDDYGLGPSHWRRLADRSRVLVIDDLGGARSYPVDIVLNQNIHARADLYTTTNGRPRLLLGTTFALLRDDFMAAQAAPFAAKGPPRVLLTVGGGDHLDVLQEIVAACCDPPIELQAVLRSAEPHAQASLRELCPRIEVAGDVRSMAGLIAAADVAVTGAGSTCWELAFFGVPMITVVLADNQAPIAEGLEEAGAALNAGPVGPEMAKRVRRLLKAVSADNQLRRTLAENGKRLVDGRGRERVVAAMRRGM